MGTRMTACEAMQRHTRRRDVRAGEARARVHAPHGTHVSRLRSGQTVGGCALSLAYHDTYPCASTHPAEHPLPGWQRAMQQTHSRPARSAFLRTTLKHVRWDCTHIERDEQDPISRGVAEQATESDRHTDYAGQTRAGSNPSTPRWTPQRGLSHTST